MTELAVRVVLKADGSGLIGQLQLSAAELAEFKLKAANAGAGAADLGSGAQKAAAGAEALADKAQQAGAAVNGVASTASNAQAAVLSLATVEAKLEAILQATLAAANANVSANDRLGDQLIETASAAKVAEAASESLSRAERGAEVQAEQLGAELTHLSAAAKAAAAAQAAAATATGVSVSAGKTNVVNLGQQRAAYTNLGYQIQDITSTLALGISPLVVLAQQGGQTAAAVAQMGGRFAGVASFIAGPFGSVILAAVSILGTLAASYFSAGDGADDLASRQSALSAYLDRTTGKIKEQVNALSLLYTAQDTKAEIGTQRTAYNKARGGFTDALGREADRTYIAAPTARGGLFTGGSVPFLPQSVSAGGQQLLKELQALAKAGEPAVNIINRLNAAAAKDASLKNAAIAVGQLGRSVSQTAEPLDKSVVFLARLAVASGTATASQKRLVAANTEGAGADLSLADARAKLSAATDGVEKAQAQLNVARIQGRAAVKAGTLSESAYEAQIAAGERAVNSAQAAERSAREGRAALRKETTAHNKEVREAEQLNRALEASYDRLSKRLDPLAFNLREYQKALREIAALQASGKINFGDAMTLNQAASEDLKASDEKVRSDRAREIFGDTEAELRRLVDGIDNLREASNETAEQLRDRLIGAADAVAEAFGSIFGDQAGGAVRNLLGGLTGENKERDERLVKSIATLGQKVGINEETSGIIAKRLGGVLSGAQTGAQVAGVAKALGIKTSSAGGQIGGGLAGLATSFSAVSSALGPVGTALAPIVSGLLGGVVGGLFKKTKYGAVTLTSADEAGTVSGNDTASKKAASGLASSVQSSLNSIADQLGGDVGKFNVTVGQRHGDYRVTTGTSLKKNKGAQDFDDDANAALAAAVRIAITQGAITGLSSAMQKAINSNEDVDKALSEALKVRGVEELIGGLGSTLQKTFKDVETVAADRVRVAKAYGLDLVKVEAANAKARADTLDQVLSSRLASVQSLLDDIAFGDLSEGSAADKRNKLLDQIGKAQADAEAGTDGAADKLANLQRSLLDVDKSSFGTAGPEYAADRAATVAALERVKAIETDRVKAAQDQAIKLTTAVETGNALANETNDTLASLATNISAIRDILAGQGITGARADAIVGRVTEL